MTLGLDGKVMEYDGENRPLSVVFAGKKTCYVYGADGARVKKVEGYAPAATCTTPPTTAQPVTVYMGNVEVRKFGQGNAEEVLLYPTPAIRIQRTKDAGGAIVTRVSTLHRDALGSVRAVTTSAGLKAERAVYRPFGEEQVSTFDLPTLPETKGYIGERHDADAGLQYLNARYYDPKLAMFIQPDWWEVMQPGVGTNRYGYSGGDPVNRRDREGNAAVYGDQNDDGKNEYIGQVNPGELGYEEVTCGCPYILRTSVSASDFAIFNEGIRNRNQPGARSSHGISLSSSNGVVTATINWLWASRIRHNAWVGIMMLDFQRRGFPVYGPEVSVRVVGIPILRRYDFVYQDSATQIAFGVEVKTSISAAIRLNPTQVLADIAAVSRGGIVVGIAGRGLTIRGVSYIGVCAGCDALNANAIAASSLGRLLRSGIRVRYYDWNRPP